MENTEKIKIINNFSGSQEALYIKFFDAKSPVNPIMPESTDAFYNENDNNVEYLDVGAGSDESIEKPANTSYKMMVATFPMLLNSPLYFVKSGNTYTVTSDFNVIQSNGFLVPISWEMCVNQEMFFCTEATEKEQESMIQVKMSERLSRISNLSSSSILVRVNDKNCPDEQVEICSGQFNDSNRYGNKLLTEIVDVEDNYSNYRFYIDNMSNYTYICSGKLKNDKTSELLNQTQDRFDFLSRLDFQRCQEQPKPCNDENLPYFNNQAPVIEGKQFTDKDFPPNVRIINSLDKDGKKIERHWKLEGEDCSEQRSNDNIEFRRASEIFGARYYLFKDIIEPDDIGQGGVGDCWLMSVLASLGINTKFVERCFKTRSVNPHGYYEVYYYENGKKHIMYVDDYFPVNSENPKELVYAQPNSCELWVLILEKVFAKYEGGFSNINRGYVNNALEFLTGCQTENFSDLSDRFEFICKEVSKGNILCAESKGNNDSLKTERGIVLGHAYSILDAKEYNFDNTSLKLIMLRNPWGQQSWKGTYSNLEEDLMEKYMWCDPVINFYNGRKFGKKGVIIMNYQEFCEEFQKIHLCHVEHLA